MEVLFGELKQCIFTWLLSQRGHRISKGMKPEAMTEPIDFVVTWVDGADPKWKAEKEKRQKQIGIFKEHKDNGEERYRDWDIFQYWFRAVEKYAPWVRNVYLITEGHVPEWLNLECPRLKHVKHTDYIPAEYLPTFNSNVIELHMHRIEGLSEHFVYFNDDMFLTKPCKPEDFFHGGKPNYTAIAEPIDNADNGAFRHMCFSVQGAINNAFRGQLEKIMQEHPELWFHHGYSYWGENFNMVSYRLGYLIGMIFPHVAVPFRKSSFDAVWEKFPAQLKETSSHCFRKAQEMNHQLVSMWNIMNSDFYPVGYGTQGRLYNLAKKEKVEIAEAIQGKKYCSICLNDTKNVSYEDFLQLKEWLGSIMEEVFPEKSSFEK